MGKDSKKGAKKEKKVRYGGKFMKPSLLGDRKKTPIPITQRERKKYKKNKVAVVFDEEERREYMAGFYGSKKRRKAEYVEKKKLKQKQLFKDNRKQVKKVKAEQIDRLRQVIEQNDKDLEALMFGKDFQKDKKEILTTSADAEVEVHTEFL